MLPRLLSIGIVWLAVSAAAPAQAQWSAPDPIGPAGVGAATIAFSPSGTGWLAWHAKGRYARFARLGSERVRRPGEFDEIVAQGAAGVALLADDGSALRLRRGLRGRWQLVTRRHDNLHGPFLLGGPRGRVAVVWSDLPNRPSSENAYRLKAVVAGRRGRPGRPQTIAHVLGGVGNAGTDVAVGFGPRGELVAVFERRERRGYGLWTRTRDPRGRLGRMQRVGTSHGNSRIDLALGRGGRMVVAWSSEDGGEERNLPRIYRAAVRTRARARSRTKRLDVAHQLAFEYPETVAATTDGVIWSGERAGDGDDVEFPVRFAPIDAAGRFGETQEIGPSGEVVDAVSAGGAIVTAWWHTVENPEEALERGTLHAAVRSAGSDAFGAPAEIDRRAGSAKLVADPSTGAAWLLYVNRDGAHVTRHGG